MSSLPLISLAEALRVTPSDNNNCEGSGPGRLLLRRRRRGGGYLQFDVPLLMDIALGDSVRITFAPKYVGIVAFAAAEGSSVSDFTHLVGLTGGVEIKVGRVFRIMPHGGFMLWANKPDIDVSPVWFTGGIALKFVFPAEAPAPVRPMYPPGAAQPPPGAAPPPPPPGPGPEPVPAPGME